jgi:hypothetical protein
VGEGGPQPPGEFECLQGRRLAMDLLRRSAVPGLQRLPYTEYSQVFFGDDYRVLRGGSWVTDPRGTHDVSQLGLPAAAAGLLQDPVCTRCAAPPPNPGSVERIFDETDQPRCSTTRRSGACANAEGDTGGLALRRAGLHSDRITAAEMPPA